jgi:predicted ATPase/DNA-binding CsgD family transcriptional regulator/Tfp pilus assembly protein PilF
MTSDNPAPPGNLPVEPNSFIGRERDLAELVAILGRVRSLTLCGPGGIGKTRLALRLAAMLAASYPDGVWIADLADADLLAAGTSEPGETPDGLPSASGGDPDLNGRLVPLVTAALGIRPEPDRLLADTLTEALRPRSTLLILDTCEHLVQACAELVQRLLAGCPGLHVIATSREPLGVRGEIIWRVPPLGLPAAATDDMAATGEAAAAGAREAERCEAVQLFAARAAAVRPGFTLDASNLAAVVDICRTLDGVPLAIELAAAWIRTLSPEQISTRLADRFELLALGNRAAPPRQQTLRATVEWSYDLLTPAERLLLSRLSVFHGWGLRMAELVCADAQIPADEVLDLLRALIDKSLVSLDGELNGSARYRLLDTVRELAAERAVASGEAPRMRLAHRDCTLDLAETIASQAFVRGEPSWPRRVAMYHRVRADRANLQLALGCCVQRGDAEEGLRLCEALSGSWLASGDVAEGAGWLDRLLAIDALVSPGVRARALAVRAELAFEQLDYDGAAGYARACLEYSAACKDGNPAGGFRLLALTELMSGRPSEALEHADAAVAAARQLSDEWEEGISLATRAAAIASQGHFAEAEEAFGQALEVLRDNNGWGVANVLYGLGRLARARRDADGAVRYFQAALDLYRQIDARPEMARCLAGIGWVTLAQGDLTAAAGCLTDSMRLSLAAGHRLAIARGLQALAALAEASADLTLAVRLAGAAQAVFDAIGPLPSAAAGRRLDRLLASANVALGSAVVTSLLAEGQAMSPHQAVQLASVPPPEPAAAAANGHRAGGQLTDREMQVAGLAARGMSNRGIGQELFITQATAARHIANIFTKLGVSSRAQLVAWIAENGPEDN